MAQLHFANPFFCDQTILIPSHFILSYSKLTLSTNSLIPFSYSEHLMQTRRAYAVHLPFSLRIFCFPFPHFAHTYLLHLLHLWIRSNFLSLKMQVQEGKGSLTNLAFFGFISFVNKFAKHPNYYIFPNTDQ